VLDLLELGPGSTLLGLGPELPADESVGGWVAEESHPTGTDGRRLVSLYLEAST